MIGDTGTRLSRGLCSAAVALVGVVPVLSKSRDGLSGGRGVTGLVPGGGGGGGGRNGRTGIRGRLFCRPSLIPPLSRPRVPSRLSLRRFIKFASTGCEPRGLPSGLSGQFGLGLWRAAADLYLLIPGAKDVADRGMGLEMEIGFSWIMERGRRKLLRVGGLSDLTAAAAVVCLGSFSGDGKISVELSVLFTGTDGAVAAFFLARRRRNIRAAIMADMITKATEPTTAPTIAPADIEERDSESPSDSIVIWVELEVSDGESVSVVDVSDVMVNSGGKGYRIPNPCDVWHSMCLNVS